MFDAMYVFDDAMRNLETYDVNDPMVAAVLVLADSLDGVGKRIDQIGLNRGTDGRGLEGPGAIEACAMALTRLADAVESSK